jgi:hypothetical protein
MSFLIDCPRHAPKMLPNVSLVTFYYFILNWYAMLHVYLMLLYDPPLGDIVFVQTVRQTNTHQATLACTPNFSFC